MSQIIRHPAFRPVTSIFLCILFFSLMVPLTVFGIRGDVNQDNQINDADKKSVESHILGTETLEGESKVNADDPRHLNFSVSDN